MSRPPPPPPPPRDSAADLRDAAIAADTWAALLSLARPLALFSLVLFFAAFATAAARSNTQWLALASMAFGLASLAHGLNAMLDSILFARWAKLWRDEISSAGQASSASIIEQTLSSFDRALAHAGFSKPAAAPSRSLDERAVGAMRLLRRQAVAAAMQTALALFGALLH